jgi:hypothetical protein
MTARLRGLGRLSIRLALPSLALFLLLAVLAFANTWADPAHRYIGGPGDSFLFIWFIRWSEFAIAHHHNPLLTTYMNYPQGVNVMWNTSVLLPGLVLSPVTAIFGPVVTYNLLMTLGLALSAWTAMVAIRMWVPSVSAATVGGALYGFSPYMFAHAAGHLHLTLAIFPPLVMILVTKVLTGRVSPALLGVLLGLVTAGQILTGEEIVASTAIVGAVAVFWAAVVARSEMRGVLRRASISLGVAVAVAGLLAAVPLTVQFFGPRRISGELQPHNVYVTDLLGFAVPSVFQALRPAEAASIFTRFTGNPVEWNAYLGVPLIVILVAAIVVGRRQRFVLVAGLTALTVAVLSLGPRLHIAGVDTGIHLPYRLLDRLPVLATLLPSRLGLYLYLAAGVLLAVFVRAVMVARRRAQAVAGFLLLAAGAASLYPELPYRSSSADTPDFFLTTAQSRLAQGEVLLVAPVYGAEASHPMLWQAEADMHYRITAGYSVGPADDGTSVIGSSPSLFGSVLGPISVGQPVPSVDPALRAGLLDELSTRRVRAVVVGPMQHQAEALRLLIDLLGRPPAADGGVYVWWLD